MRYNFFVAILVLAFGVTLQLFAGNTFGIWINFALAALITAAFFVSFLELVVLILFSVFMLNWQPGFSFELLVFSLLPLAVYFAHKLLPFKPWLGSLVAVITCLICFYLLVSPWSLIEAPNILFIDIVFVLMFSAASFKGLRSSTP